MKGTNPYNYNLPVGHDMFFGRQDDVELLFHHLATMPGDSFALVGGRRMGKTSLLEALLRCAKEQQGRPDNDAILIPIIMDFSSGVIDSVSAFFAAVTEQAIIEMANLIGHPSMDISTTEQKKPPTLLFEQTLGKWEKVVAERLGCHFRLILLLDECEQIINQSWASGLYTAMRYLLIQPATRTVLKIVMTGSHRFLTEVYQRGSPLRNILRYHKLNVLDSQAAHALVDRPTGGALSRKVIEGVYEQSGGHPFLTQYLMHHLWEKGLANVVIATVQEVADGFCHERSDFWDWAANLSPLAVEIYSALSRSGEALSKKQIRNALDTDLQYLPQALDSLCYHGIVMKEGIEGGYRVKGAMFHEWFSTSMTKKSRSGSRPEQVPRAKEPEQDWKDSVNSFTWLHLSDLHFRASESYDTGVVLQALLRDIVECIHRDGLQPDLVLVTGDIAFAGKASEYQLARRFFEDLLRVTGLPRHRLLLVPGDHDVDRSVLGTLAAGAKTILNTRDAVNRFLENQDDRAVVFRGFHNYQDFVLEFLGEDHPPFDSEHYFFVKEYEVPGTSVAILGLNTAWLADTGNNDKQLIMGERQVRTALGMAEKVGLRVAMMHHPFDWLQEFDRENVQPLLLGNCDVVLHGHSAHTGLLLASTPDTRAVIVGAGACLDSRESPNSYNFVHLNLSTGRGNIYLRTYSDRQQGFWTKDVTSYRNMDDGMYEFQLPRYTS